MKKNHKCKNPNGCTCNKGGCTCGHDHIDDTVVVNMMPESTSVKVDNNGYDPRKPYAIPITHMSKFDDHTNAQPVCWPDNYFGNLDGHVDYMAGRLEETHRLMTYMAKDYAAPDSYVCTRDNKLGYGIDNPASGRFMYGMEFGGSDDVPPVDTVITFTENNGLRHAGMNNEGELIDMGPVTNPVVIGPKSYPQALIIPITNIAAVAKAQDMLYNATMNQIEAKTKHTEGSKLEKCVDSNCMHTLPMFESKEDDKLPF